MHMLLIDARISFGEGAFAHPPPPPPPPIATIHICTMYIIIMNVEIFMEKLSKSVIFAHFSQ